LGVVAAHSQRLSSSLAPIFTAPANPCPPPVPLPPSYSFLLLPLLHPIVFPPTPPPFPPFFPSPPPPLLFFPHALPPLPSFTPPSPPLHPSLRATSPLPFVFDTLTTNMSGLSYPLHSYPQLLFLPYPSSLCHYLTPPSTPPTSSSPSL